MDIEKFEQERITVKKFNMSDNQFFALNVSGETRGFTLSQYLLTSCKDTPLEAMFSERHTIIKNSEGQVCLDRNPVVFSHMIDYMRNPSKKRIVVADQTTKENLRDEFNYWLIKPGAKIMTQEEY